MASLAPSGHLFFRTTFQPSFTLNGRLACLVAIALACAPSAGNACNLKTSKGPLDEALQEIARRCGVQLIYFSQITQGLNVPALEGEYTVEAAMRAVLEGTGLVFRRINDQTLEVQAPATASRHERPPPAPDKDLKEVVITGTAQDLVATRIATPLRDIPQTLSIISPEQIRQQNDTDLSDALANAVGITAVRADSVNQQFYSRGFRITTYHLDGGAPLHSLDYIESNSAIIGPLFLNPDLGEFDHIEVLRGADALFGADGNPGATVNLIRKQPLAAPATMLSASAGSWNDYRAEGDVTGPLAFDGALRGRLDAVFGHRDYFYDGAHLERKKLFGVFEADLTASSKLTVGGSYEWDRALPFEGGLPSLEDGSDAHLPRRTGYTFDWGFFHTQMREEYLRLDQKFGGSWHLTVNTTSLQGDADYGVGEFGGDIDPITHSLPAPPSSQFTLRPVFQNQFSVEATLTGTTEWLGRRVMLALGGDFTHFRGDSLTEYFPPSGPLLANAYDYNPADYPDPRLSPEPFAFTLESLTAVLQSGLFASLQVQLANPWSVTAGGRVSNERIASQMISGIPLVDLTIPGTPHSYESVGKVTPYIGTLYALTSHYSLYASYADIYQSNQGDVRTNGEPISPADGIDIEGGVKGSWRNGALSGSLVLYTILQRGLAELDTSAPPGAVFLAGACCYVSSGRNRSQGVDLELGGSLAPGWLFGGGYSFNNNRTLPSGGYTNALSTQTPRHLLKIWTSARLPATWSRWSVGGSVAGQSSNFTSGSYCPLLSAEAACTTPYVPFKRVQGAYVVVSPRIDYQVDSHWRIALKVNNLFDRVYYQTIGTPFTGNWYGEPRNFLLTAELRL